MSIRSDVGFALSERAINLLEQNDKGVLDTIKELADEHLQVENDHLFIIESMKWWPEDSEIAAAFEKLPEESYLIIESCFDYPDYDGGNMGEWNDNPWRLSKQVSVQLYYEK